MYKSDYFEMGIQVITYGIDMQQPFYLQKNIEAKGNIQFPFNSLKT